MPLVSSAVALSSRLPEIGWVGPVSLFVHKIMVGGVLSTYTVIGVAFILFPAVSKTVAFIT